MSFRRVVYNHQWKNVNGGYEKDYGVCPRCNNHKPYKLADDASTFILAGIPVFKYDKTYSFKCTVCPNFEYISNELAKAIIKGN